MRVAFDRNASWKVLWTTLLVGTLLPSLFLFAQNQPVQGEGKDLPEGTGKNIVAKVCKQCHGLEAITAAKRSAEEWDRVVNEMVSDGAPLKDEEIAIAAQYLAKYFGPASTPEAASKDSGNAKIHVNKDTAKELQKALGFSEEEATAIVSYREKHGNFSNPEELKKVASLDPKKIEAVKDRLEF